MAVTTPSEVARPRFWVKLVAKARASSSSDWYILSLQEELTGDDVADITKRLDRMDERADAPWTRQTLDLIEHYPAVVSTELAEKIGMERFAFKAQVRKLKRLGLTHSLEVGYRLSPRGRAYRNAP